MNKSKFLKRSLAALLAILMAVAMVPMSALAADDDTTTEPAAPAYTVVVNNREAAFEDGGFKATVYDTYILSVAISGKPKDVTVDLVTKNGNVVPLTSNTAVDLKQEATLVDEEKGVYNITLRETKGAEKKEYILAVTATNSVPVDNVDIKAVRAAEGKIIETVYGSDTITLTLPLGETEASTGLGSNNFIPANYNATTSYNSANETVTVTAANGSRKTYKVVYRNEPGFTSFKVGDSVGEISENGLTINVTVPKETDITTITPTWETSEIGNVVKVYSDGTNSASPTNITDLGIATNGTVPGVVSDRGEYDFSTPIKFFVVTEATKELYSESMGVKSGFAPVTVNVKRAEHYTGTGIKNMTAIVDPDGSAIQMATDYNVVNGDTIYLPVNYGFLKTDFIDLKLELDPGATAQITSQNNPQTTPPTITGTDTFEDVQTNGKGFTITVTAENGDTAVYRINLAAASKEEANLNRFQIGGDDGQSLAASFDRQNVEDGQFEMTIKVPFGTLIPQSNTTIISTSSVDTKVGITADTNLDTDGTDTATADYTNLNTENVKNAIKGILDKNEANADDVNIAVKFSSTNGNAKGAKVELGTCTSAGDFTAIGTGTPDDINSNTRTVITFTSNDGGVSLGSINIDFSGAGACWENTFWNGTVGWARFNNSTLEFATETACIAKTGLVYNAKTAVVSSPAKVRATSGEIGDQAVYALVSNGATVEWRDADNMDGSQKWNPIESSVTKFGTVWNNGARAYPGTKGVIYVRVKHGETYKNYRIKLVEEAARTGNEITDKSIIADDAVIGEGNEFEGAPVSGSNLFKVTVPYEWRNNAGSSSAYIYEGLELDPGAVAYIVSGTLGTNAKLVKVATNGTTTPASPITYGALNNKILGVQSDVEALNIDNAKDIVNNGRRPVVDSLGEKIYVISEARLDDLTKNTSDFTATIGAGGAIGASNLQTLANYARVYNVYYERETANNQAQLLTVNSSTPGVTASLNNSTKVVTVRVPNSFNWTAFRDNSDNDFTVDFTLSEGAKMADNADVTWASGKTTFFVRDSELCVFDKLTGRTKQITNKDANHEPQAATLTVSSQDNGKVQNNYPFRLTIAPPSSNANLSKVVVGETEAAISGSEVTVTLPAGSELAAQDVFITPASDVATVQNADGEAFDSTVKHDLREPMKFTITAEDGTKAEYTLTAKVGGSVVDPDKKPSESYTDLDKVYSGLLEKVETAINMGLMGSISGTSFVFGPKEDVHRKDVAVIIARADLIASNDTIADSTQADEALKAMYTDGEDAFDDLSSCNAIQKAAIRYCAEKEIIGGDGKGRFTPDGDLKREEMAVILTNWTGITVDKNNTTNDEIADWNNVSNWAKPYVNAVYGKMMNGVGNSNFGPKVTVSREQTASMLVDAFGILYPGYGH